MTETQVKRGKERLWETWWRQFAARKQLSNTLKEILAASREQRWKSGRCGESGGRDRDAEESEDGERSYVSRYAGTQTGDA